MTGEHEVCGTASHNKSENIKDDNYKVPNFRSIDELRNMDAEDESLRRYKEALLVPDNPKNVIIDRFILTIEDRPNIEINLKGDLSYMKNNPIEIAEGVNYNIEVHYYVQRDIVSGLCYKQVIHRILPTPDRMTMMLGSFRPQKEVHIWKSRPEETPKGRLFRGTYHIKSCFTDEHKTDYLTCEWAITVVKSLKGDD